MLQNLLEKLQLKDEKNVLIQGLPSSIEKQFIKITFSKNLTPLLKIRKIDFALVFAIHESQLKAILEEVLPALHDEGKLWIAYPKAASKISTDLNRNCKWNCIRNHGFEEICQVQLDHVWTAIRFRRSEDVYETVEVENERFSTESLLSRTSLRSAGSIDFVQELQRNESASHFFETLSVNDQKEYVSWISGARREDTRSRRMEMAIGKLEAGKRNPTEK